MSEEQQRAAAGSRVALGVLGVLAVVALLAFFWLSGRAPSGSGDAVEAVSGTGSPTSEEPRAGASTASAAASSRPGRMIEPGERLRILAADLEPGQALEVGLVLPVRHETEDPLDARLIDQGGRTYETRAVLTGSGGDYARLAVPPEWLAPGGYLIELRVREKTHLPLRRYVLVVE